MTKKLATLLGIAFLSVLAVMGYDNLKSRLTATIYRDRLEQLSQHHQQLRDQYNRAVTRTAVTELLVEQGRLSVVIRDLEGDKQTIATPFDPENEIYVDYALLDGRLWIRRVFDQYTPPDQGIVIDPELTWIDWHADETVYGKAIYRRLTDGRWTITVTGDGSLGLARTDAQAAPIAATPAVEEFAPLPDTPPVAENDVRLADVVKHLIGMDP